MNRRGTFRKWLVVCAAWITCVGLMGYVAVFLDVPRRFQYVYQVRSDVESWQEGRSPDRAPIYDVMRSPAQEGLTPQFVPLSDSSHADANDWYKHIEEGPMLELPFVDGTELHLSSLLSETDRQYLAAVFWEGRWERWSHWAAVATPWIAAALLPPLLLLGMPWIARFRPR
jgi:hypothetical protein